MRPIYTAIEKLERAPVHVAMVSEVSPTTKIIHMSDSSVHEETLSEALKKTQWPYNIMSMKTGSYDGGKAVDYMREQIKRKPGFDHINGILANANTIGISQSVVDSLKWWLRFDFFHKASDYVTCCEVVDNAIEFAKYGEVDEDDFIPNASYFANELGVDTNMILPDGTYWA